MVHKLPSMPVCPGSRTQWLTQLVHPVSKLVNCFRRRLSASPSLHAAPATANSTPAHPSYQAYGIPTRDVKKPQGTLTCSFADIGKTIQHTDLTRPERDNIPRILLAPIHYRNIKPPCPLPFPPKNDVCRVTIVGAPPKSKPLAMLPRLQAHHLKRKNPIRHDDIRDVRRKLNSLRSTGFNFNDQSIPGLFSNADGPRDRKPVIPSCEASTNSNERTTPALSRVLPNSTSKALEKKKGFHICCNETCELCGPSELYVNDDTLECRADDKKKSDDANLGGMSTSLVVQVNMNADADAMSNNSTAIHRRRDGFHPLTPHTLTPTKSQEREQIDDEEDVIFVDEDYSGGVTVGSKILPIESDEDGEDTRDDANSNYAFTIESSFSFPTPFFDT